MRYHPDTNDLYRRELRRALMPLYDHGPHRSIELQAFLASEFDVDWHVVEKRGTSVVLAARGLAYHRVRYSCRPLFEMRRAKLRKDPARRDVLHYEPPRPRGKERLVHRVTPGPAFGQLRSLKDWLSGRESRRFIGILSKSQYPTVARLAGHQPVLAKKKTSKVLKAAYAPDEDGHYVEVDPRDLDFGPPRRTTAPRRDADE
jgi:hypothetical protein